MADGFTAADENELYIPCINLFYVSIQGMVTIGIALYSISLTYDSCYGSFEVSRP